MPRSLARPSSRITTTPIRCQLQRGFKGFCESSDSFGVSHIAPSGSGWNMEPIWTWMLLCSINRASHSSNCAEEKSGLSISHHLKDKDRRSDYLSCFYWYQPRCSYMGGCQLSVPTEMPSHIHYNHCVLSKCLDPQ